MQKEDFMSLEVLSKQPIEEKQPKPIEVKVSLKERSAVLAARLQSDLDFRSKFEQEFVPQLTLQQAEWIGLRFLFSLGGERPNIQGAAKQMGIYRQEGHEIEKSLLINSERFEKGEPLRKRGEQGREIDIDRLQMLNKEGLTLKEMANRLGTSISSIQRARQKHGIRRRGRISNQALITA